MKHRCLNQVWAKESWAGGFLPDISVCQYSKTLTFIELLILELILECLKSFWAPIRLKGALKRRAEMKKILLILALFIILGGCVTTGRSSEAPRSHSRSYQDCTTNWCGPGWGG